LMRPVFTIHFFSNNTRIVTIWIIELLTIQAIPHI